MTSDPMTCTGEHPQAPISHLLDEDAAARTAELFKALADPTRLRIIGLLVERESCVGDLQLNLAMSQPAISHHLRVLRSLRLVKSRKEGRHVFYTLDDDHVEALFRQGLEHATHA
ncbi:MAG: winged helix-turn-helix transcriptional regulator [Candidatus Eremiobacteraeota bacterium]|nr:winged helix-turn-helix transcriptional regulator [Candidatus Eremiobacteraeota bacterium]